MTDKQEIRAEKAPAAIGPYSQAIRAGNTVYISGQLPIDAEAGKITGETIREQTTQSLQNLEFILNEAGMDMSNVVKTTVLLNDINDFSGMNEVYSTFFTEPYPARAAYQVAALPAGALVEIEAVAVDYPNEQEEKV